MNWYYVSAGKQTGPVDDAQLEALARIGQIQMDTLVWREGMAEWQPYSTVAPPGVTGPPPGMMPPDPAAPALAVNEVVCAECNRIFPKDETIPFGTVRVCGACKPVFMQKLAEGAKIGGQLQYARVLTRFAAVFLDGLLLQAVNIGLRLVLGLSLLESTGARPQSAERLGLQFALIGLSVVIAASYEILMIGKYGATLGKMACKLRVVTAEGGQVSYARAAGRYFAKILSWVTCMIGFFMAFFDEERRALHDRICNTRVITIA
jgi:uncharacterized RDD family membrane protein YckC